MTAAEIACLQRIHDGACHSRGVAAANHDMIQAAAERYGHRPEVIAGLLMRESRGGEALDANGRGDEGHGCGLMQIDDRWFPIFCHSPAWKDPQKNIEYGAYILHQKRAVLLAQTTLRGADLERASIAAYNCGEGNILKALRAGEDLDSRTTGKNFAAAVLDYAEGYRRIMADMAAAKPQSTPTPQPVPLPPDPSRLLAVIAKLLKAIFGVRHG